MEIKNTMELRLPSLSINEGFARSVVGAFATQLNPTLEEVADIKTAVSEAVTNAIVHAYPDRIGEIVISASLSGQTLEVSISDKGVGISDIEQARQPFFSTAGDESRSGMGFTVMETFMDEVTVISAPEKALPSKWSKPSNPRDSAMADKSLLSHDESLRLIKLAQAGDAKAQETLVLRNTALVKSIVKKFLNRGVEFDDLMQIGSLGLIKAIKGYDPSFNVRFSTYAVPMIAGEIKRFLRDDGIIKVSRSLREKSFEIFGVKEQLKLELKREPTIEELSQRLNMTPEDVVFAMEAVRSPVSIYEPAFDDENSKTLLIDTMAEHDDNAIIDTILLKEMIQKLSPKERQLIMLRFFSDKTQMEIAEILGVSQVQVSRLITKTLSKLKKSVE